MKRLTLMFVSLVFALSVVFISGCEEKKSDVGKDIKRTLDRAEKSVEQVNKRMKESLPGQ